MTSSERDDNGRRLWVRIRRQLKMLVFSHLALTMQFPLDTRVHTESECGRWKVEDGLRTLYLHSFVFPVAVVGCCHLANLVACLLGCSVLRVVSWSRPGHLCIPKSTIKY